MCDRTGPPYLTLSFAFVDIGLARRYVEKKREEKEKNHMRPTAIGSGGAREWEAVALLGGSRNARPTGLHLIQLQ